MLPLHDPASQPHGPPCTLTVRGVLANKHSAMPHSFGLGLGYSNEEDMMVWLRINLICCQHCTRIPHRITAVAPRRLVIRPETQIKPYHALGRTPNRKGRSSPPQKEPDKVERSTGTRVGNNGYTRSVRSCRPVKLEGPKPKLRGGVRACNERAVPRRATTPALTLIPVGTVGELLEGLHDSSIHQGLREGFCPMDSRVSPGVYNRHQPPPSNSPHDTAPMKKAPRKPNQP